MPLHNNLGDDYGEEHHFISRHDDATRGLDTFIDLHISLYLACLAGGTNVITIRTCETNIDRLETADENVSRKYRASDIKEMKR